MMDAPLWLQNFIKLPLSQFVVIENVGLDPNFTQITQVLQKIRAF